ncbi:MAG: hypothetical protein SGPRY_005325 [Prymnesium sp.]
MAISHANARNGAIIPALAGVRKNYSALSVDSLSSELGTLAGYRKLHDAGVRAVLGPARSATCLIVGYTSALDALPTLCPWASSPLLSNSETFPYFARVYYSDSSRSASLVAALKHFHFTRFAMIHVDDAWANQIVGGVRNLYSRKRFQLRVVRNGGAPATAESAPIVMSTVGFVFQSEASARRAVRQLAQMVQPVNVFVAIVFDVHAEYVCDEAWEQGLMGPGYVWMEPEGCENELFNASADFFGPIPPNLGAYGYDAVATLILALDSLPDGTESDGDAVRTALHHLDFEGASGR